MKPWAGLLVSAAMFLSVCAGCGDEPPSGTIGARPIVTQTFPADGTLDVVLNPAVCVWFSEDMDETSLDTLNLYVVGAHVGEIEYDEVDRTATLFFIHLLSPQTNYHAVVRAGVRSSEGRTMGDNFTFNFRTGTRDCPHLTDYLEPNDRMASAAEIRLNRTYEVLSSCGAEERNDFYRFALETTSKVAINTDSTFGDAGPVSWRLAFLRADSSEYVSKASYLSNFPPTTLHYTFEPGTYYVHVKKATVDNHYLVYRMSVATSTRCLDDAYEDNDFIDEAPLITAGLYEDLKGCASDRDIFAIDLSLGDTLEVTATPAGAANLLRELCMYDPGGVEVKCKSLVGISVPIDDYLVAEEDGEHYFGIKWWTDGVTYDLEVEVLP